MALGFEKQVKRIHYRQLHGQLDAWLKSHLWAQVLAGLILGIIVGLLMGPDIGRIPPETLYTLGEWLALPGHLFLSLIKMVLMPIVAASIVLGLAAGASDPEKLRRVGGRFAIFVCLTTIAAATLGASLALALKPGSMVESQAPLQTPADASSPSQSSGVGLVELADQAPELIVGLIPDNPLASAVQNEMLAIVIFALFLGVAYVVSPNKKRLDPLIKLLEALLEVSMTVVKWAMYLTPYAVFGLTAQLLSRLGVESLLTLGAYVGTVLLGLALLLLTYVALAFAFGHIRPARFQKAIGEAQLLAFSTSSSAAVMPLSIQTAVERLGVPSSMASFIIPLAATVNMAGTALYQAIAVIFVAQVAGVDLGGMDIAFMIITLVAASIGAPGAPGVSIAILSSLVVSFGLPEYGLVFVLGVDRFLDMARTGVNVTGDLTVARILSWTSLKRELEPDEARNS